MAGPSVVISVNGDAQTLPAGITVAELLEHLGMADKPCAVEVNMEVIPRRDHAAYQLDEGDELEVVTLVGGG